MFSKFAFNSCNILEIYFVQCLAIDYFSATCYKWGVLLQQIKNYIGLYIAAL